VIPPEDRITYAEARHITGRSHGYLFKLVKQGRLSREGGTRQQSRSTFLSRTEVEALAIAEYHPRRGTDYWMTVAEAANLLWVSDQTVRNRLPTFRPSNRLLLVRRHDVLRARFDI